MSLSVSHLRSVTEQPNYIIEYGGSEEEMLKIFKAGLVAMVNRTLLVVTLLIAVSH